MCPAVMEDGLGRGGGGQQASCLVAKQVVEFPQVLASNDDYWRSVKVSFQVQ